MGISTDAGTGGIVTGAAEPDATNIGATDADDEGNELGGEERISCAAFGEGGADIDCATTGGGAIGAVGLGDGIMGDAWDTVVVSGTAGVGTLSEVCATGSS